MIMHYHFDEVKQQGTKIVKCSGCGKRLKRSTTVWQTLNPYNRLPNGQVKTAGDIRKELLSEIAEWRRQPEKCRNCEESK